MRINLPNPQLSPPRLLQRPTIALNVEGTSARLLLVKGNRVSAWTGGAPGARPRQGGGHRRPPGGGARAQGPSGLPSRVGRQTGSERHRHPVHPPHARVPEDEPPDDGGGGGPRSEAGDAGSHGGYLPLLADAGGERRPPADIRPGGAPRHPRPAAAGDRGHRKAGPRRRHQAAGAGAGGRPAGGHHSRRRARQRRHRRRYREEYRP